MKYTWIIYDISNDKKRLALSRRCKHIGLLRVQKSVFLGQAQKKLLKELKKDASKYVLSPQDRVFFVPMTEEQYQNMTQWGADIPSERVTKNVHTLFF